MSRTDDLLEELREGLRENDAARRASNARYLQRAAELQDELDRAQLVQPPIEPAPPAPMPPEPSLLEQLELPNENDAGAHESETARDVAEPPADPNAATLLSTTELWDRAAREAVLESTAPTALDPSLLELEPESVTELPPPPHLPNDATLLEAMPAPEGEARELELEPNASATDKPETD